MSRQLSFAWNAVTNFRKWLDISGGTRLIYRISYDNYEQRVDKLIKILEEIKN